MVTCVLNVFPSKAALLSWLMNSVDLVKSLQDLEVSDCCRLGLKHMLLIRDVVQNAISTGYLTIEAEEQLRQLLTKKYDREDFNAFMSLQQAAMAGAVRQESREPHL